MFTQDQLQQVVDHVSAAQTILIIFPESANFDQIATASSLFGVLEQMEKRVSLLSQEKPSSQFQKIHLVDRVSDQLGNQNLHVVLEYSPQKVDKVRYHINEETQKFYLVIQPQKGVSPLDAKKVSYEYGGAEADMIFLIGVRDLSQLDHLYEGFEDVYQNATKISINTFSATCGDINLDSSGASCLCEEIVKLMNVLEIQPKGDIATNLLAGIEEVTDSFRSLATTARTFQVASLLMENGARRINRKKIAVQSKTTTNTNRNFDFAQKISDSEIDPKKSKVRLMSNQKKKRNKKIKKNTPQGGLDYQPGAKRL